MLDARIASAFMIYDYFRVTGAHDAVLDYADLLSFTLRDDDVQEFDTRSDEVLWSSSKIPSDDVLESLYKLTIRESEQLKTVLELYEMEIHQKDIDAQLSKIDNDGEKEYRSENPTAKLWRLTRENRNRSSDQESKGIEWDRCSIRYETQDRAKKKTEHTAASPSCYQRKEKDQCS